MKKAFQGLVSDTLLFIRQEGLFPERKEASSLLPLKKIAKDKVEIKKEVSQKPKVNPASVKKNPPLLFETIQKHLPHIKLTEKIPEPKSVALLLKEDNHPFFHNLAKAIEDRFCPVEIRDLENTHSLESFSLVLTQEIVAKYPQDKQILIAKRGNYENNMQEKKLLWSQICKHLSPKSS